MSGQILPKYTSAQIIAALHTLKTLEELEKFYTVIRDNTHLGKQYKREVKVQYLRRKAILTKLVPANEFRPLSSRAPAS